MQLPPEGSAPLSIEIASCTRAALRRSLRVTDGVGTMWLIRSAISALIVIAMSCVAQAQPRPIELEWSAPPECPDAIAVEREVVRLLGDAPPGETTHVRGSIVRDGGGLRLELWTARAGVEGTRTIEGGSCEALVEAGALVIAIAIDPEVMLRVAPDEADASESDPDASESDASRTIDDAVASGATDSRVEPHTDAITASTSVGAAPSASSRHTNATESVPIARFIAQAHATLGVGPLPSPSPGGSIAIGARIAMVEVWAGAAFLAEQSTTNGSFGLAYGRLRGCVALQLDRVLELAPCVAFDAGALWGRGRQIAGARSGTSEWIALTPALDARIWFSDVLGVSISAELAIPILARRFVIDRVGTDPIVAFEPSPVAFLGSVGLVVRAP